MRKRPTSTVVVTLCLGAVVLLAGVSYWWRANVATAPTRPLTGDPFVDDIRHLTDVVRAQWSWLEMHESRGLDLDAVEAEALALAAGEPGQQGFLRALTRYVAALGDGHGHVGLEGVDLQTARRWPFSLIEVSEGVMVDGIDPGVFRSKALQRGDLILAVDGTPIDGVIAAQERFVIAATPGTRRRQAIFALTENTTAETLRVLALRMGEDEPVTVEVSCPLRSAPVPRYSWRHFEEEYKDLDAETAYYCVGSFAARASALQGRSFGDIAPGDRDSILEAQYDEYARIFGKVANKANFVIDLRGNAGGTDLLGQALAAHLLDPGFRYYALSSRRDILGMAQHWSHPQIRTPQVGRGTPRFRGRLVCLIDEQATSTADNFAACLRDEHPNVLFVGQPTAGGSGAPRVFSLPATGAQITLCTMRVYAPNGEAIEGSGVTPDIAVRASRDDVLEERDAVLEAALEALRAPTSDTRRR